MISKGRFKPETVKNMTNLKTLTVVRYDVQLQETYRLKLLPNEVYQLYNPRVHILFPTTHCKCLHSLFNIGMKNYQCFSLADIQIKCNDHSKEFTYFFCRRSNSLLFLLRSSYTTFLMLLPKEVKGSHTFSHHALQMFTWFLHEKVSIFFLLLKSR